ncbi:jg27657 [Pararge aegeria aegeria]|uniref:Jg27657 protein n=1 Tax=Pararge aegeria aegeria TaxID=348720 RepID=A0A8S4RPP2_9NEOP|nr:jg27657 [Pararge aegeria aegeria]
MLFKIYFEILIHKKILKQAKGGSDSTKLLTAGWYSNFLNRRCTIPDSNPGPRDPYLDTLTTRPPRQLARIGIERVSDALQESDPRWPPDTSVPDRMSRLIYCNDSTPIKPGWCRNTVTEPVLHRNTNL